MQEYKVQLDDVITGDGDLFHADLFSSDYNFFRSPERNPERQIRRDLLA